MIVRLKIVAIILCLSLWAPLGCGFIGYPFQTTPVVANPAEKLEGNWLIFGSLPQLNTPDPTPGLALSLSTDGTTITGAASLSGKCSSGDPFVLIFDNAISATPDSTGHFVTSSTQSFGWGFTLTGTAPSLSGQPWSGTYELTNDGVSNICAFHGSGVFTATPIGQLTGTFTGSGAVTSAGGTGTTKAVVISATLTQGTARSTAGGNTVYDAQLMQGLIQIDGIPCFSHGVSSPPSGGSVLGNEFLTDFKMDDGSSLQAVGTIANIAATKLLLNNFSVIGGACSGNYVLAAPGSTLSR